MFLLFRRFNIVYNCVTAFMIMIVFYCTCTDLGKNRLGGFQDSSILVSKVNEINL